MEWNISLFRMINDLGKEYEVLNPLFIAFAEYSLFGLAMAILFFLWTKDRRQWVMVGCAGLTFILAEVAGKLVSRLHTNYQPFSTLDDVNQLIEKEVNNSFPSDHTILFFSFCTTFWLFSTNRYRFIWLILAVFVALSRVGVGVHYPADILVGALISMCIAFILYKVVPSLTVTKRFILSQASPEETKSEEL